MDPGGRVGRSDGLPTGGGRREFGDEFGPAGGGVGQEVGEGELLPISVSAAYFGWNNRVLPLCLASLS